MNKLLLLIFWIFCFHQPAHSQSDTSEIGADLLELLDLFESSRFDPDDYVITSEEFDCLKRTIQQDPINWPENMNDTLGNLWSKMAAQDTSIYIMIDLDTSQFKLDLLEEYKRRVIGGFAGSFPYAITWGFDVPEQALIAAIIELAEKTPNLAVSDDSDQFEGRHSYWYFMSVFDKTSNETIQIWTRDNKTDPPSTSLALVGYTTQGDPHSKQRLINRDFWKKENDDRIDYFEKMIVDQLKLIIK